MRRRIILQRGRKGRFLFFFLGQSAGKVTRSGLLPREGERKGESLRGSLKIFLRSAGLKIEEANAARIPTHRGSSWRCCGRAVIKTASAAKERNETGRKRIARARARASLAGRDATEKEKNKTGARTAAIDFSPQLMKARLRTLGRILIKKESRERIPDVTFVSP